MAILSICKKMMIYHKTIVSRKRIEFYKKIVRSQQPLEKISNERNALPKTDKNAAKQGASTVADTDKIEVSRGKLEQMRANYKGDKVFYKKDVVAALKGIDALAKLPADMREDIANRLWRGYKQKRRAIALLFYLFLMLRL